MSETNKKNEPFYDGIIEACLRIVGTDNTHPEVRMSATAYVLPGRTCFLKMKDAEYAFWVGINGPRLFFIAYVANIEAARAEEVYKFCFGGAHKVGWEINYEPIDGGVSIWANCMTDRLKPLTTNETTQGVTTSTYSLTEDGEFWVTDIAMMVQSWIRTSERHAIRCHTKEPAPL